MSALDIIEFEEKLAIDEFKFYDVQKDWTIVIGGAWLGIDVLLFAKKVRKVYALEPITPTFTKLSNTIKENKVLNTCLINAGFWDETNIVEFKIYDCSMSSGYQDTFTCNQEVGRENCLLYIWDDFVDLYNLEKVDVCKVDIEGAEERFLRKMTKCLPKRLMVAGYHPICLQSRWHQFLLLKGYIYDGSVKEYQGWNKPGFKGGSEHTFCYHLEEKKNA